MYTQCPHCDTLFRIQVADLKTAHGKVRCGHCGQIFNALRFLSEGLPEIPTVFEEVELPAPEIEPAGIVADEPHSTEELLGLVDKLVSELEPQSTAEGPAPTHETRQISEPLTVIPQYEAPLLSDVTEFKQIDVYEVTSPRVYFESSGTPFSIVEPSADVADEIAEAAQRERSARAQHYSVLGTLGWSVGILALIILLAAQYVFYMRAELAQNAALHPWLERYCEVVKAIVPCALPLLRDVEKIEIHNSAITLHPSLREVLVARLMLLSKADSVQPYPDLQLTLSDLGGQHFAQRRFHPEEYLPPGSDITQGMPRNLLISVTLEIAAPFSPVNLEASSWSVKLY